MVSVQPWYVLWDFCEQVRRQGHLDFRDGPETLPGVPLPCFKLVKLGHCKNGILFPVPVQGLHDRSWRVMPGADHGVPVKPIKNTKGVPMHLQSSTWQIVPSNATLAGKEEIPGQHMAVRFNDHGIGGMAWSKMEAHGLHADHQRAILVHVHRDAEGRRVLPHHVFTTRTFMHGKTSRDVVGVGVRGDGMGKRQPPLL